MSLLPWSFAAALGLGVMTTSAVWAASPPAMVSLCSSCHGPAGISPSPTFPSIAGQNEGYIAYALGQYKDHQRLGTQAAIMSNVAVQLSPADIQSLATYYASLKKP
jgi:cytochrome c553